MKRGPKPKNPMDRFWSKVDQSGGADACWPWLGALHKFGYGMFNDGGSVVTASAFALATVQPKPAGMRAWHHCDNPICCNPMHPFWGTQLDNMRDAALKGRMNPVRGSAHKRSKLTVSDVEMIRGRFIPGCPVNVASAIAVELGVTPPSVYQVAIGKTWRHTLKGDV